MSTNSSDTSNKTVNFLASVLIIGIAVTSYTVYELRCLKEEQMNHSCEKTDCISEENKATPRVWIEGKKLETGYLDHVIAVFERMGFSRNKNDWDVLWSHNYPFIELQDHLRGLKKHQRVNHFPGSGYITNKVSLSTSQLPNIPKAFKLPDEGNEFLKYANEHSEKIWVQKSNSHRGIQVQDLKELQLDSNDTFIQEFIQEPLLIDGRKFDIGIYTILTSINPLRVYIYDGDALLRFCSRNYYPFDAKILDSYVIGDDYTPIWKMPSLMKYYKDLHFTMKESLNSYLRSQNKSPEKIWNKIENVIRNVYQYKEKYLISSAGKFKTTRNFFEMVRFDFVVDKHLNVHLMEANMSPNLSSAHFPLNRSLYEAVIFNLLSLVGLATSSYFTKTSANSDDGREMYSSERDIAVFSDICASEECWKLCTPSCRLCIPCLTRDEKQFLKDAYIEHQNRKHCRRIVPVPLDRESIEFPLQEAADRNTLLLWWFKGKCLQDTTWCK